MDSDSSVTAVESDSCAILMESETRITVIKSDLSVTVMEIDTSVTVINIDNSVTVRKSNTSVPVEALLHCAVFSSTSLAMVENALQFSWQLFSHCSSEQKQERCSCALVKTAVKLRDNLLEG